MLLKVKFTFFRKDKFIHESNEMLMKYLLSTPSDIKLQTEKYQNSNNNLKNENSNKNYSSKTLNENVEFNTNQLKKKSILQLASQYDVQIIPLSVVKEMIFMWNNEILIRKIFFLLYFNKLGDYLQNVKKLVISQSNEKNLKKLRFLQIEIEHFQFLTNHCLQIYEELDKHQKLRSESIQQMRNKVLSDPNYSKLQKVKKLNSLIPNKLAICTAPSTIHFQPKVNQTNPNII
jgi:hypothetical protein